jgi:predicted transcriptional regulator
MSKGPAGDARRLRETNSRLRALARAKDELIATQQKLVDAQAEQLQNKTDVIQLQAERIDVLERLLAEQDKQIDEINHPAGQNSAATPN